VLDLPDRPALRGQSPVVSGLVYVLLFGAQGWFGPWFWRSATSRSFSPCPGMVLATIFVTFPFVARELIPSDGGAGERGFGGSPLVSLGASGWQVFWLVHHAAERVKLGIVVRRDPLQRARDGRVRGGVGGLGASSGARPTPCPLHVEILYNEYNFVAAFAVRLPAGTCSAIVTLGSEDAGRTSDTSPIAGNRHPFRRMIDEYCDP
jgi:sulfate transport system permease protein